MSERIFLTALDKGGSVPLWAALFTRQVVLCQEPVSKPANIFPMWFLLWLLSVRDLNRGAESKPLSPRCFWSDCLITAAGDELEQEGRQCLPCGQNADLEFSSMAWEAVEKHPLEA